MNIESMSVKFPSPIYAINSWIKSFQSNKNAVNAKTNSIPEPVFIIKFLQLKKYVLDKTIPLVNLCDAIHSKHTLHSFIIV